MSGGANQPIKRKHTVSTLALWLRCMTCPVTFKPAKARPGQTKLDRRRGKSPVEHDTHVSCSHPPTLEAHPLFPCLQNEKANTALADINIRRPRRRPPLNTGAGQADFYCSRSSFVCVG